MSRYLFSAFDFEKKKTHFSFFLYGVDTSSSPPSKKKKRAVLKHLDRLSGSCPPTNFPFFILPSPACHIIKK